MTPTPWHRRDRDLTHTTWLSPHRLKRLHEELRDLPERLALAATCLRPERLSDGTGVRSVPGSKPPINLAVVDLTRRTEADDDPMGMSDLDRILGTQQLSVLDSLASWVRLIHGEMLDEGLSPSDPAERPTVATEVDWLLRHIVWIVEQQFILELADDVHRISRDIASVLRERPTFRPRCPRQDCDGLLQEVSGFFECPECSMSVRDGRMSMLTLIRKAEPMTTGEIAQSFGVNPSTLRKWKQRGLIEPAEVGPPMRWHPVDVLRIKDTGDATRGA